jgi:hypothetical protein
MRVDLAFPRREYYHRITCPPKAQRRNRKPMTKAHRKCQASAPDLRVRGSGMRAIAWMTITGFVSPAQSGGNSTL